MSIDNHALACNHLMFEILHCVATPPHDTEKIKEVLAEIDAHWVPKILPFVQSLREGNPTSWVELISYFAQPEYRILSWGGGDIDLYEEFKKLAPFKVKEMCFLDLSAGIGIGTILDITVSI